MTLSITVKTLQQKQFKVEAELSDTVAQLKQKIEATNGAPVANQKLVFSGKILADEKTVEECNIKEKDFLVLMVSKPKPAAAPAASTSTTSPSTSTPAPTTSAPPPSDQVPPAPVPAPAEPAIQPPAQSPSTETTAASTAPAAEMPAFGDMSAFVTGSALQTSINNMVDMGFPRDQVLAAMRASFNNPDRAVDYLMNGIPEHLLAEARVGAPSTAAPTSQAPAPQTPSTAPSAPTVQQQAPAQPGNLFQAAQQAAQQQGGGPGAGRGPASGGAGGPPLNLAALQNNPMMGQIQQMLQQNPALLQPLLQNLVQTNPELAQALASNPELLMQLLGGAGAGAGGEGAEGDDGDGPIPPGAHVVHVTEEERDAIDRLVALGFPRQAAIEAYFACDKNEELAANYLFEGGFE
ncbi:hypothetical protein FRC01_002059 [Tulasnella sp. 417]|nr:hypothetical protein FRC01_002059 [Tulasnella sp. 417]